MKCEGKSLFFVMREQSRNTMWRLLKSENQISKRTEYYGLQLQCYIKNKLFKKKMLQKIEKNTIVRS